MDSILVFTTVISFLCFFTIHQIAGIHFSIHEQTKLEKNKIITEDGDVYDCIDIYKQPSLDHPLLRNHTIKLKPSFLLDESNETDHNEIYAQLGLKNGGCLDGSVPIRRVEKDDIARVQSYLKKYPTSVNPNTESMPGWHFAQAKTFKRTTTYRGVRGMLNAYNPSVANDQHSDALIYVSHGMSNEFNGIHAGWSVFPAIYGDSVTRLFTQWTADNHNKTGCIDMHCKGFVQVNTHLFLGARVHPLSTYGGTQYSLPIFIVQDQLSGDWWLTVSFNVVVGYWPKELFTGLAGFADEVGWGGRTFSPNLMTSPSMGSGLRAREGYGKSCFVQQMQYTQNGKGSWLDIKIPDLYVNADFPNCYDVQLFVDYGLKCNMYFGGPGGNCGV